MKEEIQLETDSQPGHYQSYAVLRMFSDLGSPYCDYGSEIKNAKILINPNIIYVSDLPDHLLEAYKNFLAEKGIETLSEQSIICG